MFLLLFACVIRYGEPLTWETTEVVAEYIDFRPLERRLTALLGLVMKRYPGVYHRLGKQPLSV